MKTETRNAIETAAVAEAARLCEQAPAGRARLAAAPSAAQRARAKRYQREELQPTSARVQRLVGDACRPGPLATREEFLAALDMYCAAGIAEVERRFAQAPAASADRRDARLRKNDATRSRNRARLCTVVERPRMTGHCVGPNGAEPFKWGK